VIALLSATAGNISYPAASPSAGRSRTKTAGDVAYPIKEEPTERVSRALPRGRPRACTIAADSIAGAAPPASRPRATTQAADSLAFPAAWPPASCHESTSAPSRPRAYTEGAEPQPLARKGVSISVIAPGGGTGANGAVYATLSRHHGVHLEIKGRARAPYDRYPLSWKGQGAPAPNLESFADELLAQGVVERSTCLVFGSRGGQTVLPYLWKMRGERVPPAVVINGGCAMSGHDWALPEQPQWPESAVTFLLLGGRDYFKGPRSIPEYLARTERNVPKGNRTTAILLVNEMEHMPRSDLLTAILEHLISAIVAWKASPNQLPNSDFQSVVEAASKGGWSGQLAFTGSTASWEHVEFGPQGVQRQLGRH